MFSPPRMSEFWNGDFCLTIQVWKINGNLRLESIPADPKWPIYLPIRYRDEQGIIYSSIQNIFGNFFFDFPPSHPYLDIPHTIWWHPYNFHWLKSWQSATWCFERFSHQRCWPIGQVVNKVFTDKDTFDIYWLSHSSSTDCLLQTAKKASQDQNQTCLKV